MFNISLDFYVRNDNEWNEWTNERNEWMNERNDEWMNEMMNEWTKWI